MYFKLSQYFFLLEYNEFYHLYVSKFQRTIRTAQLCSNHVRTELTVAKIKAFRSRLFSCHSWNINVYSAAYQYVHD